ncbi:MAG TPA: XRE family transcriptional regulator [Verrucomicrobiota bacterium]|nr:XRE family transcriptional regulator [Verrucomicrobiota bacterium]HQL77652.1 XRE family transcriptional regulator [Verrucomicrobiota bacterium]
MSSTALPERITQARELAGQTKTELAEKLGVSVAAVSQWEDGSKTPTAENLVAIGRVLDVPVALLLKPIPEQVARRGPISFRARSVAKTRLLRRQAQRLAEMVAEAFIWLEQWVSFPNAPLPEIAPGSSPEDAATACRRAWGLGDRPIAKLGELLESKGVRLCSASFGDVRFDAYSCVVSGRPFAFLGDEKQDRARSRFDAGHEVGHLLLHRHYSDDELEAAGQEAEGQANAFASAFLMPAATFSRDVVDPSLEGFKRLKPKWGVSIQAMVRRARDLGLITEETYERHFRNIGAAGWRRAKGEPLDEVVPPTNRSLGRKSLELLSGSNRIRPWEIPEELPLPDRVLESVFGANLRAMVPEELNNVIVLKSFGQPGRAPDTASSD